MYILFKQTNIDHASYIKVLGIYMGYCIGKIEEEYNDNRVDLKSVNAVVLTEDQHKGWVFANCYSGVLKIKAGTGVFDEFSLMASWEPDGDKTVYNMTADDVIAGVNFNKIVMKKIIEDRFNERFKDLQFNSSELEKATWEEQRREAIAYQADNSASTPVLSILAPARSGSSGGMSSGSYFSGSLTVSQLATKVVSKVDTYLERLAGLLKEQQILEDKVSSCKTLPDCHRLRHEKFGVGMCQTQQLEESISETPLTLKIDF